MSDPIELEDNFVLIVSDQGVATPAAHAPSHAAAGSDPLTLTLAQISNAGTMAAQNANSVSISGGAIAGVTLASSNVAFTGGTMSGVAVTASSVTLTGGTINGIAIGGSTPAAGAFTTGSFTGNVSISGTLAVTGAVTLTVPLAVNQGGTGSTTLLGAQAALGIGTMGTQSAAAVNIDGGTIDGTVIGGATPAAGSFTTGSFSGNATVGGTLGVTGALTAASLTLTTDLSVANGGTGASTLTGVLVGNGTSAFTASTSSTVGQVLRCTGANTFAFGALNLANTDAVTGVLPIANGGTGGSTVAAALAALGFVYDTVPLTTGEATINDASVTADTVVVVTHRSSTGPTGHLFVDLTPGVGFVIKSTHNGDANDVDYIRIG